MTSRRLLVALALLFVIVPISRAQQPLPSSPVPSSLIHVNNALRIVVQGEPDLSGWVLVKPDGTISFPLLGSVPVAGLTPQALGDLLVERLKPYIKSPRATVFAAGETEDPGHPRKWLSEPPASKPFPLPPLFPSGV